jgi:hypothetical protein
MTSADNLAPLVTQPLGRRDVLRILCACEERMRKAEYAAKESEYRSEEVKWRIDGRGIRPRRPARRAQAVHYPWIVPLSL